jgi:ABC-type glycerol-3-phosphate transport system permease component
MDGYRVAEGRQAPFPYRCARRAGHYCGLAAFRPVTWANSVEFFAALIFLSNQGKYTLAIMLRLIQGQQYGQVDWGLLQAGVMVTMLPCIVTITTLQRHDVQGTLSGSVK